NWICLAGAMTARPKSWLGQSATSSTRANACAFFALPDACANFRIRTTESKKVLNKKFLCVLGVSVVNPRVQLLFLFFRIRERLFENCQHRLHLGPFDPAVDVEIVDSRGAPVRRLYVVFRNIDAQ